MSVPAAGGDRRMLVWMAAMYAVYYAATGLHQPYFPLWLKAHGLGEGEISVILSLPLALRVLVVPALGRLADRSGTPTRLLALLMAAFAMLAFGLGFAPGFWSILIVTGAMMVVWQGGSPLLDATALNLVRRGIASDYGRLRLWGSLSFIAASFSGGFLLAAGGPALTFASFQVLTGAVFLVALGVALAVPARSSGAALATEPPPVGGFRRTLVAAALIQASHMAFNAFGSIHLRASGYDDTSIGLLWAVAAASEIGMFWAGPAIARRIAPRHLLMLAAACASLRWALFPEAGSLWLLLALQMMHAVTFSGTYLGLMRTIVLTVSEARAASAQSLFMTILSVLSAAATLGFGQLYGLIGGEMYWVAALLPILALGLLATRR